MAFSTGIAIVIGAVLGLFGAVPLLVMLHLALKAKRTHTKPPSIPVGFAAMVASALIITVEIFAAYTWAPQHFLPFSIAAVLTMLLVVSIAGIAAWRAIMREDER